MMPISESVSPVSAPTLVPASSALPLVGMSVTVDACNGLARAVVRQQFHNPHHVPLAVTYAFPLPADAAVSGYAFVIGDRRITGSIARRAEARERFEEAILEGKTAALLEQERTSLFTQEIGNIPPGVDVVAELVLDQPLRWLEEGSWEWRFPTSAAPRYLGAPGDVRDAARVAIDVADGPVTARATLSLLVRDPFKEGIGIESPTHALSVARTAAGQAVTLAGSGGVALDRDLVVRWRVTTPAAGFTVDLGRPPATSGGGHRDAAYALCTLVPPSPSPVARAVPRDVIVLLDTSGSMGGEPLDQARRVVSALIDTLSDCDQLELIEFSSQARRWHRGAVSANPENRRDALGWLAQLRASGGTEMRSGITEAMATLRSDSQRQIILVTDGQIGAEDQVVSELRQRLPSSARLHTVGVGSAVNRTLTRGAARAGRGVEVIVGLGEDPERAARRLVARTNAPLVVDVTLEGDALLEHAPERLPDLFAGAPLLVSARVRAEGGTLLVRGRTVDGPWQAQVVLPPVNPGDGNAAVVTLFGREKVEDLELAHRGARSESANDALVERLGLEFSIATRMTSWLAVSESPTVDPRDPTRRIAIPQALPYGMSAVGLGLRAPAAYGAFAPGLASGAAFGGGVPMTRGGVTGAPPRMQSAERSRASVAAPPARAAAPVFAGLPSTPRQPPSAPAPMPRPRVLGARRGSWKEGAYVLTFVTDQTALAWSPSDVSSVFVLTKEGDRIAAHVDLAHTTRGGVLEVGESARLALTFDGVAPTDFASIEIVHAGERFVLMVTG